MKISQVAVACFAFAFAASSAFTSEYSPEFMQAMTKGAKARIALKVVDDDGVSVPSLVPWKSCLANSDWMGAAYA